MIDTIENKPITKRSRRTASRSKWGGAIDASGSAHTPNNEPNPAKASSKSSLVLQMLQQPDGATIAQIVAATSWLAHTTRAALTGLKKKGQEITSEKAEGGERVYRVSVR